MFPVWLNRFLRSFVINWLGNFSLAGVYWLLSLPEQVGTTWVLCRQCILDFVSQCVIPFVIFDSLNDYVQVLPSSVDGISIWRQCSEYVTVCMCLYINVHTHMHSIKLWKCQRYVQLNYPSCLQGNTVRTCVRAHMHLCMYARTHVHTCIA